MIGVGEVLARAGLSDFRRRHWLGGSLKTSRLADGSINEYRYWMELPLESAFYLSLDTKRR